MFNTILEPLFVKYVYYFICHSWRKVIPLKGFAVADIYQFTFGMQIEAMLMKQGQNSYVSGCYNINVLTNKCVF